jgi:hypothetical protein
MAGSIMDTFEGYATDERPVSSRRRTAEDYVP